MKLKVIASMLMVSILISTVAYPVADKIYVLAAEEYTAGMYKVGADIASGEYVLMASGGTGYFCVSSDSNQNNIIFNDNFEYNSIITVHDGEYLDLARCYAIPIDEVSELATDMSGSMYKVGVHVPAGEYKLESGTEKGYFCIYSDSRHENIVSNDNFEGQKYVTVSDGQYLLLSRCSLANLDTVTESMNVDTEIESTNGIKYDLVEVAPLTENDFIVVETGTTINKREDMISKDYDTSYYFYLAGVDESPESVVSTYRDIQIGAHKEKVFEKYGIALECEVTEEDILYDMLISMGEDLSAQIMKSQCISYVAYDWVDVGQIIFYFDSSECVSWIVYSLGTGYFETYETNKETVLQVQTLLNEAGYDCGTADGIVGQKTRNAIANYRLENGMYESTVIDGSLICALNGGIFSENNQSDIGILVDDFVIRYNKAVDYYNTIAEESGYNIMSYITVDMVTGTESFSPDGELKLCVNPNTTHKNMIGIINLFAEDKGSLDAKVVSGEMMAMLYAFDTNLSESEALELAVSLLETSNLEKNDIVYDNYSFGDLVVWKGQYKGFEIIED